MQAFHGSSLTANFAAPQSTVTNQGSNQVTSPLYVTSNPKRQIETSALKSALANPRPGVVLSNPPSTNQQPIYAPSLSQPTSSSVLPNSSYWESSSVPPPLYFGSTPSQTQLSQKKRKLKSKKRMKKRGTKQQRNQKSFLNKFSDNMQGIFSDIKNYNEIPGQSLPAKMSYICRDDRSTSISVLLMIILLVVFVFVLIYYFNKKNRRSINTLVGGHLMGGVRPPIIEYFK